MSTAVLVIASVAVVALALLAVVATRRRRPKYADRHRSHAEAARYDEGRWPS